MEGVKWIILILTERKLEEERMTLSSRFGEVVASKIDKPIGKMKIAQPGSHFSTVQK